MYDLVKLTEKQSEQLQSLEAAWTTYGPALQVAAGLRRAELRCDWRYPYEYPTFATSNAATLGLGLQLPGIEIHQATR